MDASKYHSRQSFFSSAWNDVEVVDREMLEYADLVSDLPDTAAVDWFNLVVSTVGVLMR